MKSPALRPVFIVPLLATLLSAAGAPAQSMAPRDPDAVPEGLAGSDWSSIRAAYEAGRHAIQPTASGWQARNPGQQWTTTFDQRGFLIQPQDGAWSWGLALQSYGCGENQHPVSGPPVAKTSGQRLTYQWDAVVEEWFVNDQRGLEHGFTVQQRPGSVLSFPPDNPDLLQSLASPASPLSLLLATRGSLLPDISPDAQSVFFRDANGATVLNYTGLKVTDADGHALASHFEAAGETGLRLLVDERDARYPITIDPIAQQAYLKPAAVGIDQTLDRFGHAVAVSGDTVIVGAPYEDSSSTGVKQHAQRQRGLCRRVLCLRAQRDELDAASVLKPAAFGNTHADDQFGWSVAISGEAVVVGAYLEDSDSTGVNSTPNESAPESGAAYIFTGLGPLTPLQTWRQLHFGTTADSATAANLFDADGDRVPNLAEFAFGLIPTSGASLQLPPVQRSEDNLTVTFTQPAGVCGITYGAEWSTTLLAGSWTAIPDTGSGTTHTFTVPAGTDARKFLRFTVTEH